MERHIVVIGREREGWWQYETDGPPDLCAIAALGDWWLLGWYTAWPGVVMEEERWTAQTGWRWPLVVNACVTSWPIDAPQPVTDATPTCLPFPSDFMGVLSPDAP